MKRDFPDGPIVIVGSSGRMSVTLQEVCHLHQISFKILSERARPEVRTDTLIGFSGVIDFSLPAVSEEVIEQAREAQVPYVCGTTGWSNPLKTQDLFERASRKIPIIWESNFSLGIEVMGQMAEVLVKNLRQDLAIVDLHHDQKRDSPSGTALKLKDRIVGAHPKSHVEIASVRLGSIPGEHIIVASLPDETIEITHRASSRKPFALGALHALAWAQKQKPGLYPLRSTLF